MSPRRSPVLRPMARWGLLLAVMLVATACFDDGDDAPASTPSPTPRAESYVVVAGDTLANIATELGVSVAELVVANEIPDPDLIEVGQVLRLPSEAPLTAAGAPPPPLTCAEHRSLIEDAVAAAELIEQAAARGVGAQYAPFLDEIDRVSGLLVRRSGTATADLDGLLRVLARLAIDTTRLSLGQVSPVEADIGATADALRSTGEAVTANACATSDVPEPSRTSPSGDDGPVHPSRETGVA